MLRVCANLRGWLCPSGGFVPQAPVYRGTCSGLGVLRGRGHDEHVRCM